MFAFTWFDWIVQCLARGCCIVLGLIVGQLFWLVRLLCRCTGLIQMNEGGCVFLAGLQSRSWPRVDNVSWMLCALRHQESVFLFRCESKVRRSVLCHIGSRCPFDTLPPASLFLLYFHSNYKGGLQSFCVHSSWTAPAPMVAQTAFALKSWNIHEVPDSAIPRVPCMWKQTSSLSHQTSKRDRKQPIL